MRVAARWNMPFLLVFALYTQTHGELGPGGGFQAGVMIAAAFIVYGMVFGADEMRRVVPRWITDVLAALGVLIYAGTGVYCMLQGYTFLDYTALIPSNPGGAEPWGMTTVEYGVGITVSCVMITIFNEITEGTLPGDQAETTTEKA
ncbi:MAG: Na(+)/H(+) antiporter subunit B [Planctomycetes bacterium]|nr:Na(+)/H(+) antiporter subunit B [Planctomycetota bacterium]